MRRILFFVVPPLVLLAGFRLTTGSCPIGCAIACLGDALGPCNEADEAAPLAADVPHGRYLEARTAAVFAGACHFGGQRTTQGREAVCAWSFEGGTWDGVDLAGVDVVVALAGEGNLADAGARRALAYVALDQPQPAREAALALLRARYGERLGDPELIVVDTIVRTAADGRHALAVPGVLELAGGLLPDRACCAMPHDVWYEPLFDAQDALVASHDTFRFADPRLGPAFERTRENNGWVGRFVLGRERT